VPFVPATTVHFELPEQQIGGNKFGSGWQTSFLAQQMGPLTPWVITVGGGQPQPTGLLGWNTRPLGQQPNGPFGPDITCAFGQQTAGVPVVPPTHIEPGGQQMGVPVLDVPQAGTLLGQSQCPVLGLKTSPFGQQPNDPFGPNITCAFGQQVGTVPGTFTQTVPLAQQRLGMLATGDGQ